MKHMLPNSVVKLRGVVNIMRTAIAPRQWLPWRHGHDQQQHKLYLHDYDYVVTVLQKL